MVAPVGTPVDVYDATGNKVRQIRPDANGVLPKLAVGETTRQSKLLSDAEVAQQMNIRAAGKNAAASGSEFMNMAPDEKENAYKNFILNKIAPSFGMGANPTRDAWNAGLNKWMVANKISPEDVATGRAAVKFRSAAGTLQTQALLTTIEPVLDSLLAAGTELGNSSIPGWNYLKNKFNEATGQPEIVAFKNLRDDTIAEVERGLLGSGVLSDTKYIRAANNVRDSQSFPQLEAAVKNMRLVIRARLEAIDRMSVPPANLLTGKKTALPQGMKAGW
jgi:hypothetical protein